MHIRQCTFYRPVWIQFLCILLYASGAQGYKLQIRQFKEPSTVAITCTCVPQNGLQPVTKMLCFNTKHRAEYVRQPCVSN
jgi:hypothetical protein